MGEFLPEALYQGTGWQKHINTYTLRGKANLATCSFASLFVLIGLVKLIRRKPKAIEEPKV